MIFNADFFSWFNLRLYIFIPKHKQKLLHAFSRITVRLTGRKAVMLAAEANENTWRLFCGSLICFSVASFSDAFNKTQHFLCDKSCCQIAKLYNTYHVQPSERQRSEWTANESFLRLLSCVEVELLVLHRTCTATPNLCIVWSLLGLLYLWGFNYVPE